MLETREWRNMAKACRQCLGIDGFGKFIEYLTDREVCL